MQWQILELTLEDLLEIKCRNRFPSKDIIVSITRPSRILMPIRKCRIILSSRIRFVSSKEPPVICKAKVNICFHSIMVMDSNLLKEDTFRNSSNSRCITTMHSLKCLEGRGLLWRRSRRTGQHFKRQRSIM